MRFFWLWLPLAVASSQDDDDDDVGLLQANLRQLSVDKLAQDSAAGESCADWLDSNTCPLGAEAASDNYGASREECCDVRKFESDFEAYKAKVDSDNDKMIAEARAANKAAATAAGESLDQVEPEPQDTEQVGLDVERDAPFQKRAKEIDDKVSKCFAGTVAKAKKRGALNQAANVEVMINAEVKHQLKKEGLLDDADPVFVEMDEDDSRVDVDQFITGEMEDDTSEIQFDADSDEKESALLLEIVAQKALGETGLRVHIDEDKMKELDSLMKTALEACDADDKEKAEINTIMSHLQDPVRMRKRAESEGVDTSSKENFKTYIDDLRVELQSRLAKLTEAEQSVESKCRAKASKLDLDVFDSIWLKHHGGDCSKLLLEQLKLPKHRQRAAEKFRQAAELAFIFQGETEDMLNMRNGLSLHSLTPTQHLRSRMLPKDDKVCLSVRETFEKDSHRHLAGSDDAQSYVDCLCVDQHQPQICHMHHSNLLRQMSKAHVDAGIMEGKRLAAKHQVDSVALSSASSDDEDEDDAEIADSASSTGRHVGPCVYEPFFSGKICMQGVCKETGRPDPWGGGCTGICARTNKHMKAMGIWDGKKQVFEQARAALDYIAHRQKMLKDEENRGKVDKTFDLGIDCFDISATICLALQPGEKLNFKFIIGWKLPGSCAHGLRGLVENHIYINFDVCIGAGMSWLKGPLSVVGLDCFNLVSIKIYLSINCIHVEVTASLLLARGVITGQAALGPMAKGLITDYCYSINGGRPTTCYKTHWVCGGYDGRGGACYTWKKIRSPYKCASGGSANQVGFNDCMDKYNDMRVARIEFKTQLWKPWVRYNRRRRWLGSFSAGGDWVDVFKTALPCR